jgi:hypothetical protein
MPLFLTTVCVGDQPKQATVSCEKAAVAARVVDYAAEVDVEQHFVNTSGADAKEALYTFPLPERAAVFAYQATIGARTLVGQIKAKEEARQMYQRARDEGKSAQLLEQKRADVFQLSLGNVAKGSTVVVKLSYVTECTLEAGDWTQLVFPAAVGARYHPEDEADPIGSGSLGAGAPVTFTLHAVMPSTISQVHLSSGGKTELVGTKTTSSCWTVPSMARDEVVRILCAQPHEPRLIVEKSADGSHACMLTLAPVVPDAAAASKQDIVFVCDCSGSMYSTYDARSRDKQLLSALKTAVRGLPAVGARVDIVLFGSRFKSFLGGPVQLTQAVVDRVTAVQAFPEMGGTELLPALQHVFAQPLAEGVKQRQVIVMTDGEVSNTRAVIAAVEGANRANRVFTLGIGDSVSRELVSGVSRAGRGVAEYVLDDGKNAEALQTSVMRLVSLALRPALQNVAVTWAASSALQAAAAASVTTASTTAAPASATAAVPMEVEQSVFGAVNAFAQQSQQPQQPPVSRAVAVGTTKQAPFVVPPVFTKTRLVVYCLTPPGVELPTEAVLSADQLLPTTVKVTDTFVQGSTVQRLAARELIRDLEEGRSALHQDSATSSAAVQDEIRRLGLQYTLTSSETSFVAVDPVTGAVLPKPEAPPVVRAMGGLAMGGFAKAATRYMSNGVTRGVSKGATSLCGRQESCHTFGQCEESDYLSWTAKRPTVATTSPLQQILQLQQLDGSWKTTDELLKLLGLTQKKFDESLKTQKKFDKTAWITLLVLAHLHDKTAASKDIWELADGKARAFASAITDVDISAAAKWLA